MTENKKFLLLRYKENRLLWLLQNIEKNRMAVTKILSSCGIDVFMFISFS